MNTLRRIASLHRELAQAYDDLDRERLGQRRRKKKAEPDIDVAPEAERRARVGLRQAGVRS